MKKLLVCLPLVACSPEIREIPPPSAPATVTSAPSAPAPQTRTLDADTPMTTPAGASFEAPKGWSATTTETAIILGSPEHDLTITIVEIAGEKDAARATAAAWTRTTPGFARTIGPVAKPPAKDGWDAIMQTNYLTDNDDKHVVLAVALAKGGMHYLLLVDGTPAGVGRRGAQLGTVVSSFRAVGVSEESFAGKEARRLDAAAVARIDQAVSEALEKTGVPGAAIAIVQGGKIVLEKGYGTREIGKKAPVSPNTLFMIGSTTKSLTTLMMAKLVDEKKLAWDAPVTEVLPSFALGDESMTKQMQMKHTVCACTGFPRQDFEFIFEYEHVTAEDRVASMRTMKPTTGFGETFQYSNTLVASGGFMAAHAAAPKQKLGPAYANAMKTRVFDPLGMKSTTMDFAVAKSHEHALPHAPDIELRWSTQPLHVEEGVSALAPAGAIWSSAHDMAKYVALELAKGKDGAGHRVVSEENLLARRAPGVKITDRSAYGLGLFVETEHGVKVVGHGGNNLGFSSDMFFLPDQDVGVVLLYNGGGVNVVRNAVKRRVLEVIFDGKPEASAMLDYASKSRKEAAAKEAQRVSKPDEAWAKRVAGDYSNPKLGRITVRVDGERPIVDVGEWRATFGKRIGEDGAVKLELVDGPLTGLELRPGDDHSLTIEAGQQTYVFR